MFLTKKNNYVNEVLSHLPYNIITINGFYKCSTEKSLISNCAGFQVNYDLKERIPLEDDYNYVGTVRDRTVQMLDMLGCQRLVSNLEEGLGEK